jgi:hypothetical protein
MIFTGLKHDDKSKFAKYFILLKLLFRAQMVLVTFYMYNSGVNYQLIPQMIFTGFLVGAYLAVRPYESMFVNLVSITLTLLYLAILIQTYVLVNINPKDDEQKKDKQDQLNGMLIAFFVLKNLVIILDILLSFKAIWKMIERLKQLAKFQRGNVVLMDSKTRADSIAVRETSDSQYGGDEFSSEIRDPSTGSISF